MHREPTPAEEKDDIVDVESRTTCGAMYAQDSVDQTRLGAEIAAEVFRATGYRLRPTFTGGGCAALMWESGDQPSDFVIVVHDEYAIPDDDSRSVEIAVGPRDMPLVEYLEVDVGPPQDSRQVKARDIARVVSRTLLDALGPQ